MFSAQIEQVSHSKLLGVFLTHAYSMLIHNYITGIMNQGLYLLKQSRKQDLEIKCRTELFVALVITQF